MNRVGLAFAAFAAALLGCDHTVTTTIARIQRPVDVRIIQRTTHVGIAGKGHSNTTYTSYALVVPSASIEYAFYEDCPRDLELVGDGTGGRVAVRCPDSGWRVIYIGSEGRAFAWPSRLGAGQPDWSATPADFDHAAAQLYRHDAADLHLGIENDEAAAVLAEVRHRRGPSGLARFLLEIADAPSTELIACGGPAESSWRVAFDTLPAADRASVRQALVAVLETPLDPRHDAIQALRKAVAVVDLDDPALGTAPRDRLGELLARPALDDTRAARILLRWWSRRAPADAGALACAYATTSHVGDRTMTEDAMLAIAHSQHTCRALAEHVGDRVCSADSFWFCGPEKTPCTAGELTARVESEMASSAGTLREHAECSNEGGQALYLPAALLAGGAPLDPDMQRKVARLAYRVATIEDRDSLPGCDAPSSAVGTPCWCPPLDQPSFCALPATQTMLDRRSCHFTIDDAHHVVTTTSTGVSSEAP